MLLLVNPLMPTVAIRVQLLKHPVPDRVKPSFVISDVWVPGSLVVAYWVLVLVLVLVRKYLLPRQSYSAVIDTLWHLYSETLSVLTFSSVFIKSAINYI